MMKKNNGFTLVELIVTISVGALVTLAATTVILMGMRLNRQSMGITTRQNTTRIFLNAMEKMATEGSVSGVHIDSEDWTVYGTGDEPEKIYNYDSEKRVIFAKDTPIMENVLSSNINYEDGLLTVSVETEEGVFDSSIYCRKAITVSGVSGADEGKDELEQDNEADKKVEENGVIKPPEVEAEDESVDGRKAFLNVLISQYRIKVDETVEGVPVEDIPNEGLILDENGESTERYYSWWYITANGTNKGGIKAWTTGSWNSKTPWCACFVTWGVAQVLDKTDYNSENVRPSYAGVDSFMAYFKKGAGDNKWHTANYWRDKENSREPEYTPVPGDVIFYDWVINDVKDPQHVGVVLAVAGNYVYTIEGNVSSGNGSNGIVGVRKYSLDDARILGYGVLDWKDIPETDQN